MPRIPKEGCSGKLAAMPIFPCTGEPDATDICKSSERKGKPQQTRVDHVAEKRTCVRFPLRTGTQPHHKSANTRPCKPGASRKSKKTKAEVVRQANNDGSVVHFAPSMNLHPLDACGTCEASPEVQRKSAALGGTTLRTTTDTKWCLPKKAHHLHRWPQQDSWTRVPNFPVWQEKPTTRYQHAHASSYVGSSQIPEITGETTTTVCRPEANDSVSPCTQGPSVRSSQTSAPPPSRRPKHGDSIAETVVRP